MEPWFAALARPTAPVPTAAAHRNASVWHTSQAGAVCEPSKPRVPAAAAEGLAISVHVV